MAQTVEAAQRAQAKYRKTARYRAHRRAYKKTAKYKAWQRNYNRAVKTQDAKRDARFKHLYGISLAQYNAILKLQGDACAICRADRNRVARRKYLCVDHDHLTGAVRGLLCDQCNIGLGSFKDSANLAQRGADYLRAGQTPAVQVVLEFV